MKEVVPLLPRTKMIILVDSCHRITGSIIDLHQPLLVCLSVMHVAYSMMTRQLIEHNTTGAPPYLAANCREEIRATNLSLMCSSLLKGITDEEAVAALVWIEADAAAAIPSSTSTSGRLPPTTDCSDCSS